jgi:outer membrane receptor for ferrienterochelin and colicin
MTKQLLSLALIFCFSIAISAQRATISGYIKDATSGEALIGANVYIESNASGTTTNHYGFYSIGLISGSYLLRCSYIGYDTQTIEITLKRDTSILVNLEPMVYLKGVEIIAEHENSSVQSSRMGTIEMPVSKIKQLPAFLGEADVLKTIQLLPGVQAGTEGTSGFYVRGGGPDQNLILLDGVPVYNANHLFGFFSVFNPDAINHIELVKGGFPARYGGRLSSVLDIRMKEGNMKEFEASGSIGLISSKLTLEGPIIKDKTSFIVSGRRSYLDYMAQPIMQMQHGYGNYKSGYYFADLNAKVNHIFSNRDRVFLSFYAGRDRFYQNRMPSQYLYEGEIYEKSGKSNLGWGNLTSAARWTHQFNGKLFGNATFTLSDYKFEVKQNIRDFEILDDSIKTSYFNQEYFSGIKDISGRYDFDFIPDNNHYIKSGIGYTQHVFSPGASVTTTREETRPSEEQKIGHNDVNAGEFFAYIDDDIKVSTKIKVNAGLRFTGFMPDGKKYFSFEPRLSMRYLLTPKLALKGSYARMNQYVHLLANNNIGLPTDLWVPATKNVPPMNSSQYSIGATYDLSGKYQFSVESYYKTMNHVIEYREGASFLANYDNWENKVESGKAWGYGAELFLEKRTGILTGWIGYTWAKADRQFPTLNDGKVFPYKYDRRHDLSIVMNYKMDEHWDVSMTWVYGTGNAVTLPTVTYLAVTIDGSDEYPVQSYTERNSYRAAAYHRMDIGFNHVKKKKWGERTWSLGLYNAYNRKNPFYYQITTDYDGNKALQRTSLFPVIPSVSYSFRIGKQK